MMTKNILCNISDQIAFNSGGQGHSVNLKELTDPENIKRIYRIQFSKEPNKEILSTVTKIITENPSIPLRFYGDYSEDRIDWPSLQSVQKLQIDLWKTNDLQAISALTNLKELGITKNVKSSVSLKILEPLINLETLFTSVSKDIESISTLKNLRFLSLREIKSKNLDYLLPLEKLEELWLSLGSYDNFDAITKLKALKKFSIHQVRGFDNDVANKILSQCNSVKYLQLQDLKHVTSVEFLSSMSKLEYIQLDGIKNLVSYLPISKNHTMQAITASNSRPEDKLLAPLLSLEHVWLGDSYPKATVDKFTTEFKGQSFWYRGKDIIGNIKENYQRPFEL